MEGIRGKQRSSRRPLPLSDLTQLARVPLGELQQQPTDTNLRKIRRLHNKRSSLSSLSSPSSKQQQRPSPHNNELESKKVCISNIVAAPLQFKIHKDKPLSAKTKTPISKIPKDQMALLKPTLALPKKSIRDIRIDEHIDKLSVIKTVPSNAPRITVDLNTDPNSLAYQVQIPLIKLNNWYRISNHKIICKSGIDVRLTHRITSVSKFNELIFLVGCQNFGSTCQESVLLLNYKQSDSDSGTIQRLQVDDEIYLGEGIPVTANLKLFHKWNYIKPYSC